MAHGVASVEMNWLGVENDQRQEDDGHDLLYRVKMQHVSTLLV